MPSSSTAQMGATRRFCVRRAAVAAAWLAHVFSILGLNLADLIAATQPVTHRDDEEDDDDHHHPDPDPGSDLSESHEPDQIAPAAQAATAISTVSTAAGSPATAVIWGPVPRDAAIRQTIFRRSVTRSDEVEVSSRGNVRRARSVTAAESVTWGPVPRGVNFFHRGGPY